MTGISHADACALQWSPDVSVCLIFKSVGGLKGAKLIPEFSANPRNARKQSACLDGMLVENGGYRSCAISTGLHR